MKIYIKDVSSNNPIVYGPEEGIENDMLVSTLKEMVAKEKTIKIAETQLICNGNTLVDTNSLGD